VIIPYEQVRLSKALLIDDEEATSEGQLDILLLVLLVGPYSLAFLEEFLSCLRALQHFWFRWVVSLQKLDGFHV